MGVFFLGASRLPCYQYHAAATGGPSYAALDDTHPRLQILRRQGRSSGLPRGDLRRRPEWVRQVQCRRRRPLGARGAEPQDPPGPQDGGRDLPRHVRAQVDRDGRGEPRLPQ